MSRLTDAGKAVMSKSAFTEQQLNTILQALEAAGEGLGIEPLKQGLGIDVSTRTVQRWLQTLIGQGKVITDGLGRATLYKAKKGQENSPETDRDESSNAPALSAQSKQLLDAIRRPLGQRSPVGYNRRFLEDYVPNQTAYLSPTERQRLAELGKTTTGAQPAGTYARQILNRLLIDLSWNSSRLEGNTYSLLDTQRLLSEGAAAPEKSAGETQMILNHKEAIEFLVQDADDAIGFNRYTVQSLHALLSNNLLSDPGASGRLRSFGVGITGSAYTPLDTPQLIEEMFDAFLAKATEIANPFEQAFFAMVHLPYLQPFDDVNKRVSRLAANIPLNRHNLAPLSFTEVPQDLYVSGLLGVYEQNDVSLMKDVFLWAYGRSAVRYAALRQTVGEPDPFRLKYREQMRGAIQQIIRNGQNPAAASTQIRNAAEQLPGEDRPRFTEAVETELLSLHEGNFARYMVSPSQYRAWRAVWDEGNEAV